jgi:hypothetical protein
VADIIGQLVKVKVDLPRTDLSAREAVNLIRPHATGAETPWRGNRIRVDGAADASGRLLAGVGSWVVSYKSVAGPGFVRASLGVWGILSLRAHNELVAPELLFFPDADWLDSTAIAAVIAQEPLAEGMAENYSCGFQLENVPEVGLIWEVKRMFRDRSTGVALHHSFGVEASSGVIAVEGLVRISAAGIAERRRRGRIQGGGWEVF